jgi:hypothetical protein
MPRWGDCSSSAAGVAVADVRVRPPFTSNVGSLPVDVRTLGWPRSFVAAGAVRTLGWPRPFAVNVGAAPVPGAMARTRVIPRRVVIGPAVASVVLARGAPRVSIPRQVVIDAAVALGTVARGARRAVEVDVGVARAVRAAPSCARPRTTMARGRPRAAAASVGAALTSHARTRSLLGSACAREALVTGPG